MNGASLDPTDLKSFAMAVPNRLPAGTSKDGGISLRLSCHPIAALDRFRMTTPMIIKPIDTNFTTSLSLEVYDPYDRDECGPIAGQRAYATLTSIFSMASARQPKQRA